MNEVISISSARLAQEVAKQGRVNRYPEHSFFIKAMPWAIQPTMIAPVLPGETMKNALLQARVVTDPIKSRLIGWHNEHYVFYVKLRDLDARDDLTDMLLTPGKDMSAHKAGAASARHYERKGAMRFVKMCLDRVTDEYFRNEGDAPPLIDGLPPATFATKERWDQSAKLASATPTGNLDQLPGEDDWIDANIPPEWAQHWLQFERMRALKMTGDATFEDWLRQFGVTPPKEVREDSHKPELLRYVRDWSYPTNTVDPATGVPNTVVSWSIAERLDKARFFAEPGFVFAVTVTRPKVYLGRQHGYAAEMLDSAFSWLPALMNGDPYTSLREFLPTGGPLGSDTAADRPTENYWVDVRDLFLHGDQFVNFAPTAITDGNVLMRPSANMERRYATEAEATGLFLNAANNRVQMDGVYMLTIAGHQQDHT